MGEYAKYRGEEIKIGTCENMYYLRADQRHLVSGEDAQANFSAEGLAVIRFRFPFPDEDDIEPGHFEDYSRGVRVPGYSLPETLSGDEHGSVQFTSSAGYVLSIPCPEQFGTPGLGPVDVNGVNVHRNGFSGHPVVRQQAFRGDHLVTLLSCGACGALHRLGTIEDAAPVVAAFLDEAERKEYRRSSSDWDEEAGRWGDSHNYEFEYANDPKRRQFLTAMATRIEAGYYVSVPA